MHPPGTIVVPNAGHLRHVQFVVDLFALQRPEGTHVIFPTSGYVVQNLNRAILKLRGEWAWFQADDHSFKPDLLMRLLEHNVDVVVPLIVRRSAPSDLVIGKETSVVDEENGRTYPAYEAMRLDDVPDKLFTVEIAGQAGMLVRKHVLDEIGNPWFETTDGLKLNEDIVFAQKLRKAGFDIHVDPEARMAHLMSVPVWPH